MSGKIKILIVEHDPNDIELIQYELKKDGINYISEILQTEDEYCNALKNFIPDIILSDYSLPSFSGLAAFEIREKISPLTPFIFVSGTIGEENSIELIKNGVTDFVLKDKLFSLTLKVKRALEEAKAKLQKIETDEKLRKSEARFKKAEEVAHLGNWELDFATGITFMSDEACLIHGIPVGQNEQSPDAWLSFVHPDDLDFINKKVKEAQDSSGDFNLNYRIRLNDQTIKHVYSETKFKFDSKGKLTGMYGITHDITERKKAEEELEKSRQVYKNLLAKMNEGFIVDDTDGKITFANEEFLKIFGIAEDDITNLRLEDYVAPEYHEMLRNRHNIRVAGETVSDVFEYEGVRKDGKRIWVEVRVNPLIENGIITGTQSLIRDITELKKAEDVKNRLLDTLQKSLNEIYIFSPHTLQFQYVNNGALSNLGYSDEEIKKLTPVDLKPEFTEQKFKKLVAPLINGEQEKIIFFTHHKRKNGSLYPVEVHLQLFKQENQSVFLAIILDITERQKAEEEIAQMNKALEKRAAELQASNSELEHFAHIASHDLQEPLRMVSSFLTLLEKRIADQLDETGKQYIHFAVDGAGRMKTLIQDLLLYSRVGSNKEGFTAVDLNEVMQYNIRLLDEKIKETGTEITVKPLPVIVANKSLISQLFVNLVGNAIKYHGDKKPEIEIGYNEDPGTYSFYVKDNGIGIDPDYFDKIFVIFQRLHNKGEYSGTGIGLAICKKIAETHKGKIWVESEAYNGSTFYFTIPKQNI